MRHEQASILDIIRVATSELDIDQSQVENGVFDSGSAAQRHWLSLLKAGVNWLLTLQVNRLTFSPLISNTCLFVTASNTFKQQVTRGLTLPLTTRIEVRASVNKKVEKPRNFTLSEVNAFDLPDDFWLMRKITPNCDYRIRNNQLYIKGNPYTSIDIEYLSNFAFLTKDETEVETLVKYPLKNEDICILDKTLVVNAVKYMYAKKNIAPDLESIYNDAVTLANFFLGSDIDSDFGSSRIVIGRGW